MADPRGIEIKSEKTASGTQATSAMDIDVEISMSIQKEKPTPVETQQYTVESVTQGTSVMDIDVGNTSENTAKGQVEMHPPQTQTKESKKRINMEIFFKMRWMSLSNHALGLPERQKAVPDMKDMFTFGTPATTFKTFNVNTLT